jgi:maltose/maltodextrin transport system substrate-binding protein
MNNSNSPAPGKSSLLMLIALFIISGSFNLCQPPAPAEIDYYQQSLEESLIQIRPGIPGESPFWNKYAIRFINVPAFNFKPIEVAAHYRFTATSLSDSMDYVFTAGQPWSPLLPIWKELPTGMVNLTVEGIDGNDKVIDVSGTRQFYRAAVFDGIYHSPERDYRESAFMGLQWLFAQGHYQGWLTESSPDTSYYLYCYPSKIIGAVINSMLMYAALNPADSVTAMKIAINAGYYLLNASKPAGSPLEFFPPTYDGDFVKKTDPAGDSEHEYAKNKTIEIRDQLMMMYPAEVGEAYLNLYEQTGMEEFFEAAVRIADTYSVLQLENGTWYLTLNIHTGKHIDPNLCIPTGIIHFLDRLIEDHGLDKFADKADKAMNWIIENPLKNFYWEGQFEDVPPSLAFRNLSKGHVLSLASHFLTKEKNDPGLVETAEELIRFGEDQFVVWEQPFPNDTEKTENWITPCALEQYVYYVPIDASAARFIETFQVAYEATGKEIYLAKARSLANSMTIAQDSLTGEYPTYWEYERRHQLDGWINCATADARAMLGFADFLDKQNNN